ITPTTVNPNSHVNVTLVGTNFSPDMLVGVSGSTCNIQVYNLSFLSSNTAIATIGALGNQTGTCSVYVQTSQGTSNAQTFTVAYGPPTVETIGPSITGLPGQYT